MKETEDVRARLFAMPSLGGSKMNGLTNKGTRDLFGRD